MPRLLVDLTTAYEEQGKHPHGTTRVERGIVAAFAARRDPEIGFVRFSRSAKQFRAVSAEEAASIATAPAIPDRGRERAGVWVRRAWAMEGRLRRLLTRPSPPGCAVADEPFASGNLLFLPGEHDRHDFGALLALKRSRRVELVFLFYDLLRVLEDDDPRLSDRDSVDLPQTDFMVREAGLLLPISHFSAGELRRHLQRRGLPGPPIQPVRLAGSLPAAGPGRPVTGLAPGGFVLSVGDVVHRKNYGLLALVWTALAQEGPVRPLVIVGRIDLEGNALVGTVRRHPLLRDLVRFMPNVDDDALLWLYRNCRFTVFPSLGEGFGLPVAESLAYGKVCLASSATSIPEAGQGAAISLDPNDADAWLAAVRRLGDDAVLRAEEASVARTFRPVTWADTADDIIQALARSFSPASGRGFANLPGSPPIP